MRGVATRAARRAETHLRDAEAVAHLGSWEIDLATGTLAVSAEMRRILGWAWEGEPDLALVCDAAHPDDRSRVEDWLGRGTSSAAPTSGWFFRLVRPDGTLGTFYGSRALRLAHNGKPARICGTIQDVTEQVAAERAINEAAHLYRDIFENCAWGVFQTTADGRYLTANPALARIYGYASPNELLSKLTDIGGQLYVDPKRREAFVALMREHGVVHGFEAQVYRRDGAMIWITETCREVRTSTGRLLYYEGTVEDISERKRNEAAVLRATAEAEAAKRATEAANQDLERRVAERTAELRATQDELLRKERLSTLGKLTATVAHELRNPLSAIRNSMHVLRGLAGETNPAYARPLGRIERCVTRCDHIISDLIDYSHARKLTRRVVRLDDWLRACLDGHEIADGIALELRLDAAGMQVRLDGDRFARAIVNLVDNAAQAIAEGMDLAERRITVATRAGDDARIVVADTGPGIPPDVLPKVFDPLFSTKSFGTGLGLPTVKQIVEQHDGEVAIASAPGRGTSVEIKLPRAERH
ncbi:MAG TPA: ATP-binding protein [Stellaceae bacterium]|nr:ATP-binding protein [Stellaceae bacterium]